MGQAPGRARVSWDRARACDPGPVTPGVGAPRGLCKPRAAETPLHPPPAQTPEREDGHAAVGAREGT